MDTSATTALRRLPRAALIYGLGDLAPKALYFVLLPWYLKYLPPGEFGIIALASTFSTLLGLLLQLNLNGSVFRYYLDQSGEDARQQLVGTLILFQVASSFTSAGFSASSRPCAAFSPLERESGVGGLG